MGRPSLSLPTKTATRIASASLHKDRHLQATESNEWQMRSSQQRTYRRSSAQSVFVDQTMYTHYKFEPKASRRPSQSLTTNSRECHGMLASSRANSTPLAAYSA